MKLIRRPRIRSRFKEAAKEIAGELGVNPPPDVRIGRGRITVKFKQLGASGWSEARRIDHAFQVAAVIRELLGATTKRSLRRRASRAVVVTYEDATLAHGCDIDSRWICVVPAAA
jgi:hypothetical protein